MIYTNGTMQLILIKKVGKDAYFVNTSNNELIYAHVVKFNSDSCNWSHGSYFGNISNYIDYTKL